MNEQQQSAFEEQMLTATGRELLGQSAASSFALPESEVQSLRQSYRSLEELLQEQMNEVDEQALIDRLLSEKGDSRPADPAAQEGWAAMLAVAASVTLLIGLAGLQLGTSRSNFRQFTKAGESRLEKSEQSETPIDDTQSSELAWDDDWDQRLSEASDYASDLQLGGLTQLDVRSLSADRALEEMQGEIGGGSL